MIAADHSSKGFPAYSTREPGATLPQAYAVQRSLVLRHYGGAGGIGGYKGGFSSSPAMDRFGIDRPALGALPAKGRLRAPYLLRLADFRRLVVECELGFELAHDVTERVDDEAQVRALVASIGPAVELPDVRVTGADLSLVDHISANISAARFIFEPLVKPDAAADINAIMSQLERDGITVGTGGARLAFGDQWAALRSILNTALEQGYRPSAGDVILTGALVQAEAEKGHYVAHFDNLGKIEFAVR
ncbi:hypothetical protein I5E68_12995 [Novosphingobium sp. YJ-S2-02]|uniref:2-keto-4-pentenoate hydratase n=1 Tax=Novosphingobium aureum TaxID=2792964 RepID=A0A931HED1_9SPHN|nr:hypothetical protein [Novosphingobium aureum]MBH0113863.1 hypothetical protein [Novosphingobium aureum]